MLIFQKSCIDFTIQARPLERYMPKERNSVKYKIWRIVVSTPFEYFIMILIVLNTLLLMMKVSVMISLLHCNFSREIRLIRLPIFLPDQLRCRKEESVLKYELSFASNRKQNLCALRFTKILSSASDSSSKGFLQTLWPALFSISHIAAPNRRRHKCNL